ncbi:hypothetical protein [Phytohabitans aurantiacus]|uniref:hypothetical protein n=1 Tax=Phytohabitans aurantiacus TaxID=3016789 RepID=UPI002492AC2F|nr:hypothetical protein [Phytohabitans aurantiacus]
MRRFQTCVMRNVTSSGSSSSPGAAGWDPAPPTTSPASPEPRNVPWQVLDPKTGRYRDVNVGAVTTPTADLRYAMVAPLGESLNRIGRYETTTGKIRWYDLPFEVSGAYISPDGRHAAVLHYGWIGQPTSGPEMAVVDLTTGQVKPFELDAATLSAAWTTLDGPDGTVFDVPQLPLSMVSWKPDSRHFTLGNVILDLDGRRTGVLPVPAGTLMLGLAPDGAGVLVNPGKKAGTFALTDRAGGLAREVTVTWPCPSDPPCPNWAPTFIGWRGPDQILIWHSPAPDKSDATIEALDLRTGTRETVHHIGGSPTIDRIIIASSAHLSDRARKTTAF